MLDALRMTIQCVCRTYGAWRYFEIGYPALTGWANLFHASRRWKR